MAGPLKLTSDEGKLELACKEIYKFNGNEPPYDDAWFWCKNFREIANNL
ncbi:hypothetical protein [Bacillus clarus]|uniref:Uncharacterized protein n=1 Tax=Bacillus clarus TaxID=2338372 RepID=A0A090YU75_9BACI|nr:hypothetical protein [Bacillus clarus]KFM95600.1 hypothetical protein DJ93_5463 [Bacillus clarus]